VLDAYTVEIKLDDTTNQMIVLQEGGVFDLEFIVKMAHSELGIGLACECFGADFAYER